MINNRETLIYINGLLASIELLNMAPNSAKDYGFVAINADAADRAENLRLFLEAPKWDFKFILLDGNWKQTIVAESNWAFTEMITQNYGYPVEIGFEKHQALAKKFHIDIVQEFIFNSIENLMRLFHGFEVYRVEIIASNDNSGYFAHGESNYLFQTTDNKLFLLYFRASD